MHTARLPIIRAPVATKCQYWCEAGGPQVNEFEQVSDVGGWAGRFHFPHLEGDNVKGPPGALPFDRDQRSH